MREDFNYIGVTLADLVDTWARVIEANYMGKRRRGEVGLMEPEGDHRSVYIALNRILLWRVKLH